MNTLNDLTQLDIDVLKYEFMIDIAFVEDFGF